MLYYELLKPNKTVTTDRYASQLNRLSREIDKKRPCTGKGQHKMLLLNDNSRPHVVLMTRQMLMDLEQEILSHLVHSLDITPSEYYIFRSMWHSLGDSQSKTEAGIRQWTDDWNAFKNDSSSAEEYICCSKDRRKS